MELKEPLWLDKNHPNYNRWQKGRDAAIERGKFAVIVVEEYRVCKNLTVLDLGSGEGGTTEFLSYSNKVYSADISLTRLLRQPSIEGVDKINTDAQVLPFKEKSFDLIVLQDVLEHIERNLFLLQTLPRYLKSGGFIYVSTPNKHSILNIISDPHWGLPLLCLFKRQGIRKHFLSRFRKSEVNRSDIAELVSLEELWALLPNNCTIHLNTITAVEELLKGNKGIVWSSFHLFLVKVINKLKLNNFLLKIANNKPKVLNKYFTPTFYLILAKKPYQFT